MNFKRNPQRQEKRLQLCWETFTELQGFLQGSSHQIMGMRSGVPHQKAALPPRPCFFFLFLSRRQRYQLCQVHRQRRSGTLFLTCPSLSQRNSANETL